MHLNLSCPAVSHLQIYFKQLLRIYKSSHCANIRCTISLGFVLLHLQVKRYAENVEPLHLEIHPNGRFVIVVKELVAESVCKRKNSFNFYREHFCLEIFLCF